MADPGGRSASVEEGGHVVGSGRKFSRPSLSILRKVKREQMVKKMALAFRFLGCLFSLVSLSVMAADKNQGRALDSFDRHKEFRSTGVESGLPIIHRQVNSSASFSMLFRFCFDQASPSLFPFAHAYLCMLKI